MRTALWQREGRKGGIHQWHCRSPTLYLRRRGVVERIRGEARGGTQESNERGKDETNAVSFYCFALFRAIERATLSGQSNVHQHHLLRASEFHFLAKPNWDIFCRERFYGKPHGVAIFFHTVPATRRLSRYGLLSFFGFGWSGLFRLSDNSNRGCPFLGSRLWTSTASTFVPDFKSFTSRSW